MEGQIKRADQNMRDATDFWNHFGAAHKLWTFEEIYNHWKRTKEKNRSESKNNVDTKDPKKISKKTKQRARKNDSKG